MGGKLTRRMRYWELNPVAAEAGWRRLGNSNEHVLGRELDRHEAALVEKWANKRRVEED